MNEEIGVGSIVSLSQDKYLVLAVQIINNTIVPKELKAIRKNGELGTTIHKDTYKGWGSYNWKLVSNGVMVDPKEKLYEKVRYLDRKFKERITHATLSSM